jgi:DNA-binding protein HU-beta
MGSVDSNACAGAVLRKFWRLAWHPWTDDYIYRDYRCGVGDHRIGDHLTARKRMAAQPVRVRGGAARARRLLTPRPAKSSPPLFKGASDMAKPTTKNKPLTKSEILNAVADAVGEEVARKHVKAVIENLVEVGHKELKKNGIFVLHGFAKFVVVKKPARPARKGINPFTKREQTFAAKPASKAVRARPVKAVKDAVK